MQFKTYGKALALLLGLVIAVVGVWPDAPHIPVAGATSKDWNPKSFWYEPWGVSGVHKGIDIFAAKGTSTTASVSGLVVYSGQMGIGGNVVAILGPKWRIYYYAHLDQISVVPLSWATQGQPVGTVGISGNAVGKPPHLHFSIVSMIPLPWRISNAPQGWKLMFFLNPAELISRPGV